MDVEEARKAIQQREEALAANTEELDRLNRLLGEASNRRMDQGKRADALLELRRCLNIRSAQTFSEAIYLIKIILGGATQAATVKKRKEDIETRGLKAEQKVQYENKRGTIRTINENGTLTIDFDDGTKPAALGPGSLTVMAAEHPA